MTPPTKPPPHHSEAHVFISVLLICAAAGAVQIILGRFAARLEMDARRRVWFQNASTFAACFCAGSTYRTWKLEYLGFPLVSTLLKTMGVTAVTAMLPSSTTTTTTSSSAVKPSETNVTKFVYLPIFGIMWGFEECLLSTVEQVEDVTLSFATIGLLAACFLSRLASSRTSLLVSFLYLPLATVGLILATFPFLDKVGDPNLVVATVLRALRLALAEYLFTRDYVSSSTALVRHTGPYAVFVCFFFALFGEIVPSFPSLLAHILEIIGLLVPDAVFTYFTIIATKELVRDTSTSYAYALINMLSIVLIIDSVGKWKLDLALLICGALVSAVADAAVINHLFKYEFGSSSSSAAVGILSSNALSSSAQYEKIHYDNPFWSPRTTPSKAIPPPPPHANNNNNKYSSSKIPDLGGDDDDVLDVENGDELEVEEDDEEFLREVGSLIAPPRPIVTAKQRRVAGSVKTSGEQGNGVARGDVGDENGEEEEERLLR